MSAVNTSIFKAMLLIKSDEFIRHELISSEENRLRFYLDRSADVKDTLKQMFHIGRSAFTVIEEVPFVHGAIFYEDRHPESQEAVIDLETDLCRKTAERESGFITLRMIREKGRHRGRSGSVGR
jgi:hypothetical protein